MRRRWGWVGMLALEACGVRHVAPAEPPPKVTPSVIEPSAELAPGVGRVYLDVVEGPTPIALVTGQRTEDVEVPRSYLYLGPNVGTQAIGGGTVVRASLETRSLCTTPCWVDLPVGEQVLVIADEQVPIDVRAGRSSYVRTIGRHDPPSPAATLPYALLGGLGLGVAVAGPLVIASDEAPIGIGMSAGGVALALLGYLLYQDARPIDQPGSGALHPLP